jgi:hypothetical protein
MLLQSHAGGGIIARTSVSLGNRSYSVNGTRRFEVTLTGRMVSETSQNNSKLGNPLKLSYLGMLLN